MSIPNHDLKLIREMLYKHHEEEKAERFYASLELLNNVLRMKEYLGINTGGENDGTK